MPFVPCPKHGCFKLVGGLGLVARRCCKGIHESEFGRKGGRGDDGNYVEKGREQLVVYEV